MGFGAILNQNKVSTGGTTYTNEQILNPSDATLIGLTGNPVPADMFHTLATVGDLHVWRRTTSSGTDYPVSVNPNAYQTGNDAQPAGYTLGEVQSGEYALNNQSADPMRFYYADDIVVDDEGNVSIGSTNKNTAEIFGGWNASVLLGKFIQAYETGGSQWFSDFEKNVIYFIPSDAEVTTESGPVYATYINKRQPVTGYPAIPAGTTIEYMGKLGDKARIVTGSYVGTGTYGSRNKTSVPITSDAKFVCISAEYGAFATIFLDSTSDTFISYIGMDNQSAVGRTNTFQTTSSKISWYASSARNQLNETGEIYHYAVYS